jgi:hypothetical protein
MTKTVPPLPPIDGHEGEPLVAELVLPAQSTNQPTAHVSDKVTASTVGAAIIALVVAVISRYGVEVDAVTATAVTPLAVLGAGWLMRERR